MYSAIEEAILQRFNFTTTPSQREAVGLCARLLMASCSNPALVIYGYAGTGKTTLMRALADVAESGTYKVRLMAPTGRAAKVLERAVGRKAMTIHRAIYRQENNDFLSSFGLGWGGSGNTLYIVDEASMISDEPMGETEFGSGRLLTDLVSYVFSAPGNRIVFVGDPAQLPPIGVDVPPVFNIDYLRSLGLNVIETFLTDVVRQAEESLILKNALSIRHCINNGSVEFPKLVSASKADVERVEGDELIEVLHSAIDKYGEDGTLVITRSNKRATLFNNGIRGMVLDKEDELTRGDRLMVVKNNYLWRKPNFIANGDMAQVVRIKGYKNMYGLRFADVTLKFIDGDDDEITDNRDDDFDDLREIDVRIMLDVLQSEQAGLSMEQMRGLWQMVEEDYADIGDKRKRYAAMREDAFLQALQVKFAYSVTCHKAQGGQWECVFIDVGYVTDETLNQDLLQWLYTAITRATKKVYLVNFPKEFF